MFSPPPLGEGEPPYAVVVRFKDYVGPWPPEVAWNLVVRKMSAIDEYDWRADVAFKVDHAPHSERERPVLGPQRGEWLKSL